MDPEVGHTLSADAVKGDIFTETPIDEPKNTLAGLWGSVVSVIAIAFSVFQLYSAATGLYAPPIQRGIHLAFALSLAFLVFPARGKAREGVPWYDLLLAVVGVAVGLYQVVYYEHIANSAGDFLLRDEIMAVIAVLVLFEATR